MEYSRLDKKIMLSWRIGRLIRLVIFAAVFAVADIVIFNELGRNGDISALTMNIIYAVEGAALLYCIIGLIVYPIIEYRQWKYLVAKDRVEISHGIFFVTESVIPVVRIQHISSASGPINRALGLVKLTIHTASGQFAIEGLTKETAASVSSNLKTKLYNRLDEGAAKKDGE